MPNITFKIVQKPIEERLIDAACIYWDVEREYFHQKKEESEIIYRKGIVYYLIKNNTLYSYRYIANLFGFASHQPVMRLINNIESSKDIYRQTKLDLSTISQIAQTLNAEIVTTLVKLESITFSLNESPQI